MSWLTSIDFYANMISSGIVLGTVFGFLLVLLRPPR
jgi:hypothetical protein